MGSDMRESAIKAIDDANGADWFEIFGIPVIRRGGFDARIERNRLGIAAQLATAIGERANNRFGIGKVAVDQQRFHCPANAGAPHLGVDRNRPRHIGVGGGIDIGVVDPVEMREDGHTRIGLNPRHERLAAARNDDVDLAMRRQHRANGGAVRCRDQLDRIARQPCRFEPRNQSGMNRLVRIHRFGTPAQNRGIARHDAQHPGICRHVRAAFVNDPDDAKRHTDAREFQAIGPRRLVDDCTDRVRQCSDGIDRARNPFDPCGIDGQPVDHRCCHAARFGSGEIDSVRGHDRTG